MSEKLCYVDREGVCYFTANFEKQWGDDWNDAPYEHNAGEPYDSYYTDNDKTLRRIPIRIEKIVLLGPFRLPCHGYLNSPFSVESINRGEVPWIRWNGGHIMAGTSYIDFSRIVNSAGFHLMYYPEYMKLRLEH